MIDGGDVNHVNNDKSSDLFRPARGVSAPVLLSTFTFISVSLFAWLALDTLSVKHAGRLGLLVGFFGAGLFWFIYLKTWFASVRASFIPVVQTVEKIVQRDIDGDGEVGKPTDNTVIRFDLPKVSDSGSWSEQRITFPAWVDKNQLVKLAAHVVNGGNFSEPQVVRKNKIYTPSEFLKMRELFFDQNLIEWKNYNNQRQGVDWTDEGMDFLERIEEQGI